MDFKNYFDIPSEITYLNTPGNGLLPKAHLEWRKERDLAFYNARGDLRDKQSSFIKNVKCSFSELFNCPIERLFFVPNFSFGFNTLLGGLDSSLHVALIEDDYPSLNYPIISRGFNCGFITPSETLEENIYSYVKLQKPDVLALSIVNYINGLQVDLTFIKRLKNEFPDLLIFADATQFLGTEPFDFENSGFDAVIGSGYKWMLSGYGNGYVMLSEYLASILYQSAQIKDRPKEAMWSHKSILDIYFEPGHQDTLSYGTLEQSILFFQQVGLDAINSYLTELKIQSYRIFEEKNWLIPMVKNRSIRSSLINLQIDPTWYDYLLLNGIKCFPRGKGIRIGLHLYNSMEDIEKLVNVVERKNI